MEAKEELIINTNYFPFLVRDETYQRLFAVQTVPEFKIWFKDKEITDIELVQILQRAE